MACLPNVSFALFFVFLVFFIISIATPFWFETGSTRYGLWTGCVNTGEFGIECGGSKFKALKAMIGLALICYFVAFVIYFFWMCACSSDLEVGTAAWSITLCGGCFNFLAVFVYVSIDAGIFYPGWSFALTCFSGIVMILYSAAMLGAYVCCECSVHGDGALNNSVSPPDYNPPNIPDPQLPNPNDLCPPPGIPCLNQPHPHQGMQCPTVTNPHCQQPPPCDIPSTIRPSGFPW